MDWCSYFRCQDGSQLAEIDQAITDEASNYTRFQPEPFTLADGSQIQMVTYHRETKSDPPRWVRFFEDLTGQSMDALSTYLHEIEKFGFRAAVMVV